MIRQQHHIDASLLESPGKFQIQGKKPMVHVNKTRSSPKNGMQYVFIVMMGKHVNFKQKRSKRFRMFTFCDDYVGS
jgi:hypothetical protein